MNRLKFATVAVLVAGSTVALVAQPAVASDKTVVTVNGCVAAGEKADHYLLTKAAITPAALPTATGTAGTATKEDAPAAMEAATSYQLKGGDLKAHLGHQVEVTGTISQDLSSIRVKSATPPAASADAATAVSAPTGTLDVKSVKMIAATCS